MASMKPTSDPYRILGVLRGADPVQIKAAHRRLAKRFHPDGGEGDEDRFLAVQEAYQLLSDPIRRREWDRRHAPGPMRASGSARSAPRRRPRADAATTVRRGTPRPARASRPPGQRKTTWSAEHVPWWDEFTPPGRPREDARRRPQGGAGAGPAKQDGPANGDGAATRGGAATRDGAATGEGPARRAMDFDVFDRSSGAAWSSAARRHFRRGTEDLPSRGVWRYRGTQVVTGAEARKVAEEDEEEKRRR